jgi:cytochrome b561
MSTSQVSRYHPILVALHWALAILIIADLTIGALVLVHIPNDVPRKIEGLRAHMSGGIVILILMFLRLAMRAGTTAPAKASAGSAVLDRVAWLSHRLLYFVVFAMALSGLVMGLQAHLPDVVFFGHGRLPASFWDYPLRGVHYFLSRLLMALIALHIAGALYHTFIRRDHLLRRMWFGRRNQNLAPSIEAAAKSGLSRFWDYAPWLARVVLAFPTLLFIRIGAKYVSDPLQVTAGSGIVLGSPAAITDTRAVGAMFLAFAALTLFSIFSTRRLLAGLILVASVVGFVTAARVLGLVVDGAAPETSLKLVPEVVLFTAAAVGILVERRRQRHVEHARWAPAPISAT